MRFRVYVSRRLSRESEHNPLRIETEHRAQPTIAGAGCGLDYTTRLRRSHIRDSRISTIIATSSSVLENMHRKPLYDKWRRPADWTTQLDSGSRIRDSRISAISTISSFVLESIHAAYDRGCGWGIEKDWIGFNLSRSWANSFDAGNELNTGTEVHRAQPLLRRFCN